MRILGDRITPYDPLDFRGPTSTLSPSWRLSCSAPTRRGRDVLSRVMAGARDVLKIAPLAALLGVVVRRDPRHVHGLPRRLARHRRRAASSSRSCRCPSCCVALLAITTLGNSSWVVIGVVATLFTPIVARTVRSAVLAERDLDYVTSAKLRGESQAVHHVPRDPSRT